MTFLWTLVFAAEGGEEAGGIALLLPDTAELVWGAVAFALLLFFMWKFVYPALNATLEQRQGAIQQRVDEAEQAHAEASRLAEQYREQLANARQEAERLRDEARQDAERIRSERVEAAEQDAESIRAAAREEAAGERARVIGDLRAQVATISVELAEKIVQRELDAQEHRDLVDRYINELSSLN